MSESKRFKGYYTSFEQLPNELFLHIFGYLNGVDAVYAFSQMNNRFRYLLINYINIFDFKSISKAKFDCVTKHHDTYQWRSLRLSDDHETPGQIKLFCQLYPPHRYLSQLQSLCVFSLKPKYAQEFVSQLVSFDHLVSLTIGTICGENIEPFELPSLKRLVVTACGHTDWMMKFHHLERLEYTVKDICHQDYALSLPTTLKHLKLFYDEGEMGNIVRNSLQRLSQLTTLTLYDHGDYSPLVDGRMWEALIQTSIPLLKTFQFCFPFHNYHLTLDEIKQAVNSFSTLFYLTEKRWFIHCNTDYKFVAPGIIYSLPYAFQEMPINTDLFTVSFSTLGTSNIDGEEEADNLSEISNEGFLPTNNISLVLNTKLTTNWLFSLTESHHLEMNRYSNISSTDFARLLASLPLLRSLTISANELEKLTDKFTNTTVCNQLSRRIRSLTLAISNVNKLVLDVVNICLLSSLVRLFGKTCEHLSFALAVHPNTVLSILRDMEQLRSAHLDCDPWYRESQDTATSWLKEQVTCSTELDFVHITDENTYSVWFGSRP